MKHEKGPRPPRGLQACHQNVAACCVAPLIQSGHRIHCCVSIEESTNRTYLGRVPLLDLYPLRAIFVAYSKSLIQCTTHKTKMVDRTSVYSKWDLITGVYWFMSSIQVPASCASDAHLAANPASTSGRQHCSASASKRATASWDLLRTQFCHSPQRSHWF